MKDYVKMAGKVLRRINELALISEHADCLARTFGTNAFLRGSKLVYDWMQEAGLNPRIDHIGNIRGRLTSKDTSAGTFVIGSHIDTVINAGKFDGPLGVLAGLAIMEDLASFKVALPFNIELVAFSDEEGVRFHTTYLGSRVLAGSFDNDLLEKKDASGVSLRRVIRDMGGNPALLADDALKAHKQLGYYEIHIEQGPVLFERNMPVAVVSAIAGQKRIMVCFEGVPGHAGTVPMNMRNDALCCAAEFILALERFALEAKASLVATVGRLDIANAASNVIPGQVSCSIDLRSCDEQVLTSSYELIHDLCKTICLKREIDFNWDIVQETKPVACDKRLNDILKQSIAETGVGVLELVSGAGHDAVALAGVMPVSMLFVRCYKGISHNPLENAELKDIAAALEVTESFLKRLIDEHK